MVAQTGERFHFIKEKYANDAISKHYRKANV